tara:strand:- start:967 stop:1347 length:381 start_codon:yes stop_codon:yes gene_type:complete
MKKIPKTIDTKLGIAIIDKFDIPEIFMAVNSSDFLIFKKNQIPDIKTTKGKKFCSKLGVNNNDKIIGVLIFTLKSLKKLISSNKCIINPKVKKIILVLRITLKNSLPRYLFIKKDLIMFIYINFHI